ncbi:MAG: hypothetical protein WC254_07455 [Candidatus Woesearchaeota archaeon]|jgi:hypothetical protein
MNTDELYVRIYRQGQEDVYRRCCLLNPTLTQIQEADATQLKAGFQLDYAGQLVMRNDGHRKTIEALVDLILLPTSLPLDKSSLSRIFYSVFLGPEQ